LGEAFTEDVDPQQILHIALTSAMNVAASRAGAIYLYHEESKRLVAEAIEGILPPLDPLPEGKKSLLVSNPETLKHYLRTHHIPLASASVIAEVFRSGVPSRIPQELPLERLPVFHEPALQIHSLMLVPLQYRRKTLGVMVLANSSSSEGYTRADFEMAQTLADQTSFTLFHARAFTQLAEKRRLDDDLSAARQAQRILLPQTCPVLDDYSLAAINRPAQYVSGDFYDFLKIDDHRLGIVIADVSGKGMSAALIMAMTRTLMRIHAPGEPSAAEVLKRVNRNLYRDTLEEMFVTMIYMVLDYKNHTLTLGKAGHEAPLLSGDNNKTIKPLQSSGMALGIDSGEVFDTVIDDLEIPMHPNDAVLVYTDGINEAIDSDGQEFGREQIQRSIRNSADKGPTYLSMNILDEVAKFRGEQKQNDDITLIALKRK
jgi:sigma-B regulation protein RsbU (phosphoserine phosphatase)